VEMRWDRVAEQGLRGKLIHEGSYLMVRIGLGFVISFCGMLYLMRLIGVENYGMYATVTGIVSYIYELCTLGIIYYLIRSEKETEQKQYHLAFTFILVIAIFAFLIGFGMSFLLSGWLHNEEIQMPFIIMLFSIFNGAYIMPAMAMLERGLNYRKIAFLEFYTQIIYYVTALTLGLLHFGIWAPIIGNLLQGISSVVICYFITKYRPAFYWDWDLLKSMLKYVFGNTASKRIWALRNLVNPLLVAKFVGLDGVACISLAIRVVEALCFVNKVFQRISFSLLSKIQGDKRRVENAINEAMILQILSLAPFLIGFGTIAQWIIPYFFGEGWSSASQIYPFIAIGYIVFAMFNLHVNLLYVNASMWEVFKFNIVHVVIFITTSYLTLRSFGIYGYAFAEMAALASYFVIHLSIRKNYRLQYRLPLICLSTCIPIVFLPTLAFPWALLLLVPALAIMTFAFYKVGIFTYIQQFRKMKLAGE
jgi:O-antigen/teichoic acid export membrane protein